MQRWALAARTQQWLPARSPEALDHCMAQWLEGQMRVRRPGVVPSLVQVGFELVQVVA